MSSSDSSVPVITKVIRKQDIIDALMGVTEMSTAVAKSIAAKQIGINILGDKLFESTLDLNKVKDPKGVNGYQDGVQTYIRRSAVKGFSVFLHEEFMNMNSSTESHKQRYLLVKGNDEHTGMNTNIKSRKVSISSTKILMKLLFTLILTMIHKEAIMNLTDKLIQFDKTEDTSIFNTTNKYTIPECWGVCVSLFEWLKLEHKRYLLKLEGRPTTSKTLTLHPEAEFTRLIPDFIESDDVFRHSLKITENQLYFSDEITEDEVRTITKSAFDYYNPGRSYN